MALLLGIDTGGTYTDAVILDDAADRVVAAAKALTTRPDLSQGIAAAIDAAIARAGIEPRRIAMVSLSTTLATNALVEGHGGRVALVFIGFDPAELDREGLAEALRGDPVIALAGGHSHSGAEIAPLDLNALSRGLQALPTGITGIAVAGRFATRNPAHELAARDLIRAHTGLPVTCSHELSAGLNGPRRALTALLNARLIGMIDRLIAACHAHMALREIDAPLMVVRGDGALVSAELARERPIETILSGPAASVAGARWLSGAADAIVSDIGGTTTDVCLLRAGRPRIDPDGARVGGFRTMVEAVAMRTTGLGGDSEVHLTEGLRAGLRLGPRRLVPVALLARNHPGLVHGALDAWLAQSAVGEQDGRFAIAMWAGTTPPEGLDRRETEIAQRLAQGPARLSDCLRTRLELPALMRLVQRGLVMLSGITPSDAAHVLGRLDSWDTDAARKALMLFARRRDGRGDPIARDPESLARAIVDQLTRQTVDFLLECALAEDSRDWAAAPETLARHELMQAALDRHAGTIRLSACLGVPVIGLGASAPSWYGAVGERLGTRMILPEHAGVANAIGAVVGQVAVHAEGSVTSPGPGQFVAHLPSGPTIFGDQDTAVQALAQALCAEAEARARHAGVEKARLEIDRDIRQIEVEGQPMFIEARLRVTASGRPRIATG
ncbi:N-methylhydantoinase A/oxoprolinase/acetone carboxylase beta subunit [Albidovulum inexpectatum]|uniref:N-methylhydantoinase A/oxoprolinase/acetone carboxylase beta subunit n=1 Tax=Albidovulum inexpectatum TaxID=196587 RepID=A0A2S5JGA7_9RHOB|nr:hydantoinase/oxoprolinase family protein [Albidovulum inexpectatum]PPB80460.1 N-methylhydantoinase A/oxoprolinase/acetone carboxylase beta subunit [Albidovulum inexpectatum]